MSYTIDRIVRKAVRDMPTLVKLLGNCGSVMTCEVSPAQNGYFFIKNIDTGQVAIYRGAREFDTLIPGTIADETELYLHLWNEGIL